jgi:hypothetical protein
VASRAAVEAGDVGKVIIDRQFGEPDLLDFQRPAEGIDDRQGEDGVGDFGEDVDPFVAGFFQLIECGLLIFKRFARLALAAHDIADDVLQVEPLFFGDFDELVLSVDLVPGFLDLLLDLFELLGSELVADAQLVLTAIDVEEGGLEFLLAQEVVLAKAGVGHELFEFADQLRTPLLDERRIFGFGRGQEILVRFVDRIEIWRFGVALLGGVDERLLEVVDLLPRGDFVLGVYQGRPVVGQLMLVLIVFRLLDARFDAPRFDVAELALEPLPLAMVIGRQHPDRGQQHQHGADGEDQVHPFGITPDLFRSRHSESFSRGERATCLENSWPAHRGRRRGENGTAARPHLTLASP